MRSAHDGRGLRACLADLLRALALLAGLPALAAAPPGTAVPSIEDFTKPQVMQGVVVSPNNSHAALLVKASTGRTALAVMELANPRSLRILAAYGNVDVHRPMWVNDKRLVYEVFEPHMVVSSDGAGTLAVDVDGERERTLITWRSDNQVTGSRIKQRVLPFGWVLQGTVGDGSDDVLVTRRLIDSNAQGYRELADQRQLARLNTVDGDLTVLSDGLPKDSYNWILDGRGELRAVQSTRDGRTRLHWRAPDSKDWVVIEDHAELSPDGLAPLYLEANGELVVLTQRGGDTSALYTYDPKQRRLSADALAAIKGFDVGEVVDIDRRARTVAGLHGVADRSFTVWFDAELEQTQKLVDSALPKGRVNKLLCGDCLTAKQFVVASWSDRHPGEYFVFDKERGRLTSLGAARPWLPESTQGRRSFHRVPARDGLTLPVVVTHPPGRDESQPLPAVVLVHGGPWLRGATVDWSDDAQFLATRGYRVIEVDFRGSAGLGSRHFTAGWGQWGLTMQDDLIDAVDWAVTQRMVDPQRVCIMGGSYGGYAALMGPVRHPGRYRCAASYAGLTDVALMFDDADSDITVQSRQHSLRELIGDPVKDAERFRQTSPLHRVADIKVPLLVGQGRLDRRVTKKNADRFLDAARGAGVSVESVEYADEGHSLHEPHNRVDWLTRLEAFLARSLKP